MSELKPCPFCGKENTVAGSTERMILGWWYACEDCFENRKGGVYEDRWNTRPIEDALNARIAELEAERRWIPVSERLPERDGFYLVLENVNQVAGYYHWCKVFGWNTDGGRTNIQSVTHWMPLPEPPEVK